MIVSIVLLLSSCGSNNPLSAKSPNAVTGQSGLVATSNTPPTLDPASKSPLPAWFPTDPASMSYLLSEPHANINASGPSKPFDRICGGYSKQGPVIVTSKVVGYNHPTYACFISTGYDITLGYQVWKATPTPGIYNYLGIFNTFNFHQDMTPPQGCFTNTLVKMNPPLPQSKQISYIIPCNDPCFKGMNLPDDFFAGSGFPDGYYVAGGNLYEKGTDAAGNPTVKNWGPTNYPDGVYPKPPAPPPPPPPPPTANITNIVVTYATNPSATTFSVAVGSSMNFVATAFYSDGSTQDITSFATWMTIDSTYISVVPGIVVGVDAGQMDPYQASFGVMYGGKSTWVPITVIPKVLKSIFIIPPTNPTKTIYIGETQQFNLIADYGQGSNTIDVSDVATWSISPANVGTITAGVVTGTAEGMATITATFKGVSTQSAIEVKGVPLKTISVTPASNTIYIYPTRGTVQYTATGSYLNGKKPAENITQGHGVTWHSDNISVATIDNSTGLATAGTMQGTTYIWAASTAINQVYVRSDTPDAELCVECFQYTHYRQNGGQPWSNNPLAYHRNDVITPPNRPITIGRRGCAVTSAAMALTATGTSVDPGQLEAWLFDNGGFAKDNTIKWWKAAQYPGSHLSNWHSIAASNVTTTLNNCQIVIVSVNNSILSQHWVILVKEKNGNYLMYDPWMYTQSEPTPNLTNLLDVYNIQYGYFTYDVK